MSTFSATRASRPQLQLVGPLSVATGALALAAVLGLLVAWGESHHHLSDVFAVIGVVTVLGALTVMPLRWLPAVALLVSLLIPAEAAFLPKLLEGAALGAVPLAVWAIRARGSVHAPAHIRFLALLFGAWLILSEAFAPFHTNRGWEWLVVSEITLVLIVVKAPAGLDPAKLRSVFLTVTTVVGVYALLEGFIIHSDPLFGRLFEHTLWWGRRHFAASYRISTLFGQPLDNGLVFSAAAALAASELMERRDKAGWALLRLAILVGAVTATHERGSALGLAVGMLAVLLFTRSRQRSDAFHVRARRLGLFAATAVGAAVLIIALQARSDSTQGRESASIRTAVVTRTTEALRGLEPFGAGPGEVDEDLTEKHLNVVKGATATAGGANATLENSYAEVAVDLGPIGASIAVLLLAAILITGLRTPPSVGEAAALAALLVDIGGYNAIQGQRSVLVLIALFTIAILTGRNALKAQGAQATPLRQMTLPRSEG
jgi:hypothetical protein